MKIGTYGFAGLVPDKRKNNGVVDTDEEVLSLLEGFAESDKLKEILSHFALLSQVPVVISVTDITAMTGAQLDALRCCDCVIKKTGDLNHAYRVSFKNETGICLTYVDASVVETVSYDKIEGVWTYNSTDVTHISE